MDSLNLLPNSGTASNDPREIERQASQGRGKCGVEICAEKLASGSYPMGFHSVWIFFKVPSLCNHGNGHKNSSFGVSVIYQAL